MKLDSNSLFAEHLLLPGIVLFPVYFVLRKSLEVGTIIMVTFPPRKLKLRELVGSA